jgi:predicted  nucleic acid-binding Zn-ribbon protein
MAGTKLPPRRKARAARVEKDARDETRVEKARVDADAARKEARRLASEAADAEREARRLRSEADRAERRLRDAEDRLAKARGRSSRSPSTRMS